MAKINVPTNIIDSAMLKAAMDIQQQRADSIGSKYKNYLSSFKDLTGTFKDLGRAYDEYSGEKTREEQISDFLNKYQDDPSAKAAAYNFISGKDPNAISTYEQTLATKAETKARKDELELEKAKQKELAIAQAKNSIAAADEVLNGSGNDYKEIALANKQKKDAIATLNYYGVPYVEDDEEDDEDEDMPDISNLVSEGVIDGSKPVVERKSLADIKSDFRNISSPTTEDIENYLEVLKNNDDNSKNFADAIETTNKMLNESKDKDWNIRVDNIKNLRNGYDKAQAMEKMNEEAKELGRKTPFSADDIKKAKPSTIRPLVDLNPSIKADRDYAKTHHKKDAKIVNGKWTWGN